MFLVGKCSAARRECAAIAQQQRAGAVEPFADLAAFGFQIRILQPGREPAMQRERRLQQFFRTPFDRLQAGIIGRAHVTARQFLQFDDVADQLVGVLHIRIGIGEGLIQCLAEVLDLGVAGIDQRLGAVFAQAHGRFIGGRQFGQQRFQLVPVGLEALEAAFQIHEFGVMEPVGFQYLARVVGKRTQTGGHIIDLQVQRGAGDQALHPLDPGARIAFNARNLLDALAAGGLGRGIQRHS